MQRVQERNSPSSVSLKTCLIAWVFDIFPNNGHTSIILKKPTEGGYLTFKEL